MSAPPAPRDRRGRPQGTRDERGHSRNEQDGARDERGQTTIDFAIGAGLFLIVVAFTFAFIPTMFAPFVDADRPQAADRAASTLAADSLGQPDRPYILNRTCTVGFFDHFENGASVTSACRFDTSAATVNEALGIADTVQVNVTIQRRDGGVMSLDGVQLATGQRIPGNTGMTTARRSVYLAGETRRLVVRIW